MIKLLLVNSTRVEFTCHYYYYYYYYYYLIPGIYNPDGVENIEYKIAYNRQSLQSVASRLSCRRTALKRCTRIEILWYRKLVSRASLLEFSEILPRIWRRWRADALMTPTVSTAIGSKM